MAKARIYINSAKKSLAAIQAETGADVVINGGLYDLAKFKAVCHLKADGYVYAEDIYSYWGFGWNNDDTTLNLVAEYDSYDNYIACVALLREGKAQKLIYDGGVGGSRARSAVGTMADGRIAVYCSTELLTPEALQEKLRKEGWQNALMLDGGSSSQCIVGENKVQSGRVVHNVLCFWEAKPEAKAEFRVALGAGHGINSAGKRCMKSLDPNETREWWLNDRVCDYIAEELSNYEGYALLRTDDDDDGEDNIALSARAAEANAWGADVYLSIHHNAGINGGKGGGIVAYSHIKGTQEEHKLRDELYEALIAETGLEGDRWDGTLGADFQILREVEAPAVLLELGFMDSATDVPVILSDAHARKCARAIVSVLVRRGKLMKKVKPDEGKVYRVQLGAFSVKDNAEVLAAQLRAAGYPVYITMK